MSFSAGSGLRGRIERALAGPAERAEPPVEPSAAVDARVSEETASRSDEMSEGTDRGRTPDVGPRDPRYSGVYVLWSHRGPPRRRVDPADVTGGARSRPEPRAPTSVVPAIAAPRATATSRDSRPDPEIQRPIAAERAPEGPAAPRPGLQARIARHVGRSKTVDVEVVEPAAASSPGFVREVSDWPRIAPRPPLLVGRPLELPGAEGWRSALTWLFRQVDSDLGERPVFLDVEATGLGHGAGTVAFVVGLAALDGDRWRVEQWVLSRLSAETAMLADLQARLAALDGLLVTFNGASFDLPLLRGRLRRCGLPSEVLAGPHLDLLPVARRLWKGRGPDCRLGTLERLQLGARREGDITGRAVPELFWAALRAPHDRRACEGIRQVCGHNLVDVLTMPALALAMARTLARPDELELAVRAADHLNAIGRRAQAVTVLGPWGASRAARGRGRAPAQAPEGGGDEGPSRLQRTVRGARVGAGPGS